MTVEEEITLDLKEIFGILRKRLKLLIIITLISTLVSAIISIWVIRPTFEAKTSIVIGKNSSESNEGYTNSDVVMYQKLIKTYAAIAKANDVALVAVEKLNPDMSKEELEEASIKFQNCTKVTPQADTQVLEIKIESKDPLNAKEKVDALTEAFMIASKKIYPNGNVEIMDSAKVPKLPVKPNKKLNIAIAFFLGLMVSVGIVFLLEYMDNTFKSQNDVEKYLEIPVIGLIPDHAAEG
jgi:capsular polysaccharide biosynthesis protein